VPLLVKALPANTDNNPLNVVVVFVPVVKAHVLFIVPVPPKVAEFVPASVSVPPLTNKVLFTFSAADKVSVTVLVTVNDLMLKAISTKGAKVVPPLIVTSSPLVGVFPELQFPASLQFMLLPPVHETAPAYAFPANADVQTIKKTSILVLNFSINNLSNFTTRCNNCAKRGSQTAKRRK